MISRQPKLQINGALSIFQPLRCRVCRWIRSQSYKVDFKPESVGGFLFLQDRSTLVIGARAATSATRASRASPGC